MPPVPSAAAIRQARAKCRVHRCVFFPKAAGSKTRSWHRVTPIRVRRMAAVALRALFSSNSLPATLFGLPALCAAVGERHAALDQIAGRPAPDAQIAPFVLQRARPIRRSRALAGHDPPRRNPRSSSIAASHPRMLPSSTGTCRRRHRSPANSVPVVSSRTVRSLSVWAAGQACTVKSASAEVDLHLVGRPVAVGATIVVSAISSRPSIVGRCRGRTVRARQARAAGSGGRRRPRLRAGMPRCRKRGRDGHGC